MGWDVTITCQVRKTIHIDEAKDEAEAVEMAHQMFSCLADGSSEKYEQETEDVKETENIDLT